MSELSELRPRSEVRKSAAQQPTTEGIARHGQLKKQSALPTVFKFIAAALAVVLVSGASVGAIALNSLLSKTTSVALIGETAGPPPQIGAIKGGFNILIVGTDTRLNQGGIGGTEDDVDSALNDVNILVHVSEDQSNATAISFPRDMVVGIPECPWQDGSGDVKGYSTEAINTALYYGGLPCVVATVEELTGLPIQFAGMIDFAGVVAMADAIGGVEVCTTGPMIDPYSGINIPSAGTWTLTGGDALAFLRSRHGVGDGSDLTRISSQQVYLSSMVRTLQSGEVLSDIPRLYAIANTALKHMTFSNSLADPSTMVSIALALKDIPTERITFVQYPGTTGGSGVYSGKVQPQREAGDALMALVAADQPFVLASNGDGTGSTANPNAAPVVPDPNSTAAPIDNTGLPVVEGVRGQTAASNTCSVTQDASEFED